MKHAALLAIAGAVLMHCAGEAQPAKRDGRPRTVLLELFTSQGCSSCPPADELLSRLQRERFGGATVVPIAYHVDYWNHIGWTDPFSSARWSQRQNQYASAFESSQVYTPQLVINGRVQLVGSAEGPIRSEIERQLKDSDSGTIAITGVARAGNELRVGVRARLDAKPNGTHAKIIVTLLENGATTAVRSGENAHRTLSNDAIVRWQNAVAAIEWNGVAAGGTAVIPLDPAWRIDRLGLAAFIQDSRDLSVYATAVRKLAVAGGLEPPTNGLTIRRSTN